MKPPRVYRAITAVSADLAKRGIAKSHTNVDDRYDYRSINDLLDGLSPLLVKHRLCVLPRTLERVAVERAEKGGAIVSSVTVRVAFDLISSFDGSAHCIESYGEALDASDKATAKAMSAAYKTAMFQTFCVPVRGTPDADAQTIRAGQTSHLPEPVQGWDPWARDIIELIAGCETLEAIARVQSTYRALLQAIGRERKDLYEQIGSAFAARRGELSAASPATDRKATERPEEGVKELEAANG